MKTKCPVCGKYYDGKSCKFCKKVEEIRREEAADTDKWWTEFFTRFPEKLLEGDQSDES